jgi:hypothetical protein
MDEELPAIERFLCSRDGAETARLLAGAQRAAVAIVTSVCALHEQDTDAWRDLLDRLIVMQRHPEVGEGENNEMEVDEDRHTALLEQLVCVDLFAHVNVASLCAWLVETLTSRHDLLVQEWAASVFALVARATPSFDDRVVTTLLLPAHRTIALRVLDAKALPALRPDAATWALVHAHDVHADVVVKLVGLGATVDAFHTLLCRAEEEKKHGADVDETILDIADMLVEAGVACVMSTPSFLADTLFALLRLHANARTSIRARNADVQDAAQATALAEERLDSRVRDVGKHLLRQAAVVDVNTLAGQGGCHVLVDVLRFCGQSTMCAAWLDVLASNTHGRVTFGDAESARLAHILTTDADVVPAVVLRVLQRVGALRGGAFDAHVTSDGFSCTGALLHRAATSADHASGWLEVLQALSERSDVALAVPRLGRLPRRHTPAALLRMCFAAGDAGRCAADFLFECGVLTLANSGALDVFLEAEVSKNKAPYQTALLWSRALVRYHAGQAPLVVREVDTETHANLLVRACFMARSSPRLHGFLVFFLHRGLVNPADADAYYAGSSPLLVAVRSGNVELAEQLVSSWPATLERERDLDVLLAAVCGHAPSMALYTAVAEAACLRAEARMEDEDEKADAAVERNIAALLVPQSHFALLTVAQAGDRARLVVHLLLQERPASSGARSFSVLRRGVSVFVVQWAIDAAVARMPRTRLPPSFVDLLLVLVGEFAVYNAPLLKASFADIALDPLFANAGAMAPRDLARLLSGLLKAGMPAYHRSAETNASLLMLVCSSSMGVGAGNDEEEKEVEGMFNALIRAGAAVSDDNQNRTCLPMFCRQPILRQRLFRAQADGSRLMQPAELEIALYKAGDQLLMLHANVPAEIAALPADLRPWLADRELQTVVVSDLLAAGVTLTARIKHQLVAKHGAGAVGTLLSIVHPAA